MKLLGIEDVHNLDCSDCFMGVSIHQNLSMCTVEIGAAYYVFISPQ